MGCCVQERKVNGDFGFHTALEWAIVENDSSIFSEKSSEVSFGNVFAYKGGRRACTSVCAGKANVRLLWGIKGEGAKKVRLIKSQC